ncbi:hypothetical protein BCR32DRAFT_269068 [Anaeromyces robustus]|uniref:Transmembrane protein n=1 Tax=Anaeromyces robustus TaxID=1754192 RepID=A0A1Y1X335_9FUNG|nr:hypothetical protein BCR32DRAFT_269068 [Anaeromyces robustus]|eukprot:ORX80075.1 hypothetical protein BCR32DRAFT_269068 [Anaeromyces robustus]
MSTIFNELQVISKDIWVILGDSVNKAQYFGPFISWVIVTYCYFDIGRNAGPIWKYLFYVVSFGFLANILDIIKLISMEKKLYFEYIRYVVWVNTYLFGINEWGFLYINFTKIRACVKMLKGKIWCIFMNIFLVYILFCRTLITMHKFNEDYDEYYHGKNDKPKLSSSYHALSYIPIGVIEVIFLIFVIIQYFNEKGAKNEIIVLFHSTLTRTLTISFVYIFIAILVLINNYDSTEFLRKLCWRIKGVFGIIILVDLLLLRIDLDKDIIQLNNEQIEKQVKLIYGSLPQHTYPTLGSDYNINSSSCSTLRSSSQASLQNNNTLHNQNINLIKSNSLYSQYRNSKTSGIDPLLH